MAEGVRLNRFLASAGLGSRRSCESIILEGRVTLDGVVCDSLGTRVLPYHRVAVDGERVRAREEIAILLHKPPDVVTTRSDPEKRTTVYHLLPSEFRHLHYAGRLDRESEGLLLLTNSGQLTQLLTHPASHVPKEYEVTLDRAWDPRHEKALTDGMETEEGYATALAAKPLSPRRVQIILEQGLKRQIRLMLDQLGYRVRRLVRVRLGPLKLDRLPPGRWRPLSQAEIQSLHRAAR
ncbi:MAG: pseudouridine synthase [Verrucomicrobiota bacterium]